MEIEDKKERANTFQITKPWSGPSYNLLGWLDTDIRDQQGEATVRYLRIYGSTTNPKEAGWKNVLFALAGRWAGNTRGGGAQ